MKRMIKLFPFLVTVVVSLLVVGSSSFFFSVAATYVEGDINQDTVWTLTDSPFIVSKDVTIYSGATLTIEPGVEVRFGGNFRLIVNGRLIANGTQDRMITFSSNKDQPGAGDWSTIEFSGLELSKLAYCSIKYATNAISVVNGVAEIENNVISNNFQDGILILGSTVEVWNNDITYNSQSGIYATGDNQANIQNNTITSNSVGILLTGNSISGVNITQNRVLSNTQSGITLDADAYSNIAILYNVLSANNKGFYVSGQASTYIANNSISHNTIGISYEKATGHEVHWNDVYGNDYGMNVPSSGNATVNAEYNYWGDESGPYHTSLNPFGKGNPAGGNGKNLDFIPFLTAPIGYINERPTARLLTDKTLVRPDQTVMFIATTSSDDRRVDQYFFNFGDGENSGWTTLSIFVHRYSSLGTYVADITVMDDFGVTSTEAVNVTIDVQDLPSLDVSLTATNYSVSSEEQVPITVHATDGANPAENANVTLFPIVGGSVTPSSGFTNSTGYFAATFTAPKVTKITNVRITAKTSKSGYTDGSDYKYIEVLPPLSVQITTDPAVVKSEETSNIKAHITYSGDPVAGATVIISSDGGGNFSTTAGTSDLNGDCTFVFTAPQTTTWLNITMEATATKIGYVEGQGQTILTVEPKILVIQVAANPSAINSEGTSQVTAHVTHDGAPVSDATVTVSSESGGSFSSVNGTTNPDGDAEFTFTAPQTTTPINATITATAAKAGFVNGQDQVEIGVNPGTTPESGGGGLPLTTILLIAVPIIAVVVVVILIKMKIIYLSSEQD